MLPCEEHAGRGVEVHDLRFDARRRGNGLLGSAGLEPHARGLRVEKIYLEYRNIGLQSAHDVGAVLARFGEGLVPAIVPAGVVRNVVHDGCLFEGNQDRKLGGGVGLVQRACLIRGGGREVDGRRGDQAGSGESRRFHLDDRGGVQRTPSKR